MQNFPQLSEVMGTSFLQKSLTMFRNIENNIINLTAYEENDQLKQPKEMLITIFNEVLFVGMFFFSCRIIQQHLCHQMRQKGLRQKKSLSVIQLLFTKSEC